MEIGKGWHEWFMSIDYIPQALHQLEQYGVKPEQIKMLPMSETLKRTRCNADFVMYYYLDK